MYLGEVEISDQVMADAVAEVERVMKLYSTSRREAIAMCARVKAQLVTEDIAAGRYPRTKTMDYARQYVALMRYDEQVADGGQAEVKGACGADWGSGMRSQRCTGEHHDGRHIDAEGRWAPVDPRGTVQGMCQRGDHSLCRTGQSFAEHSAASVQAVAEASRVTGCIEGCTRRVCVQGCRCGLCADLLADPFDGIPNADDAENAAL